MRFLHIEDKDKRRWLPALVILTAAVLLSFVGITVARYITRQEGQGIAEADNFYFTSDLLREKEENACYYVDPQTKEITVTLSNAADARRVTPGTITYRVEVTGGTVVSGSGSLPGGKKRKLLFLFLLILMQRNYQLRQQPHHMKSHSPRFLNWPWGISTQ